MRRASRAMRSASASRRRRSLAAAAASTIIAAGGILGFHTLNAGAASSPGSSAAGGASAPGAPASSWPMAGGSISDDRDAASEHTISAQNVSQLKTKWTATSTGDWIATPTVVGGTVYEPDSSGHITAFDATTGAQKWQTTVAAVTGVTGDASRTSPAYSDGLLVLGDQSHGHDANIFAVDAATGAKAWSTSVSSDPAAMITGAVTISDGVVYVGVSSNSETLAASPTFKCCTFRASMVALSAATGKILWQTYMVPDNGGQVGGYSGGAIWSTAPAVDPVRHLVFIGTGNNYTVPSGVCTAPGQTACTPPAADDYVDSILALDTTTGKVVWSVSTEPGDSDTIICDVVRTPTCGHDFDFGAGPNLFTATIGGQQHEVVGIGQKSGIYWAVDAATGKVLWKTTVGAGTDLGGIEFGTATDGKRIYVAEADGELQPYPITLPDGSQKTIRGGSWAALDPATGKILWQTPDPQGVPDEGSVSVANGVLYAPSESRTGNTLYALDAATGKVLWGYAGGGPNMSGPSIVDGMVYWGTGYTGLIGLPSLTPTHKLYAFSLGGGSQPWHWTWASFWAWLRFWSGGRL